MKKYVAAVQVLRKNQPGDESEFTTKIGGKTNLGRNFLFFKKFSFPVTHFMLYYAKIGGLAP